MLHTFYIFCIYGVEHEEEYNRKYIIVRLLKALLEAFCAAQILAEDTRLRAACTEASQSPPGGGVEERLQMELSDILAQKSTMQSEVNSVESRVRR